MHKFAIVFLNILANSLLYELQHITLIICRSTKQYQRKIGGTWVASDTKFSWQGH